MPSVFLIAGPNGAGKTTVATSFLRDKLSVQNFVNADTIAAGLSAFSPDSQAMTAGRIMIKQLRTYADERRDFAFESTLSGTKHAVWLEALVATSYEVKVAFIWLSSPERAVDRVKARVAMGGHSVPEGRIRRRYWRGMSNFMNRYRQLAVQWSVFDNSEPGPPDFVARGSGDRVLQVSNTGVWNKFEALSDV